MPDSPAVLRELSLPQRYVVLTAAILGWLFAGLEIALFPLIHDSAMASLKMNLEHVPQWFAWYQAAFLFGAASGGWVFGWLGDRLGRTQSLALSVLCYSLLTGACYFANTPFELLVLRFLACHGIGGAWPNTVALVAEAWPDASRPFLAGLLGTAANIGQVLMGVIGLNLDVTADSWRWTLLVGAAPVFVGLWCLGGVPESVRWLTARAKPNADNSGPLRELFGPAFRGRVIIGTLLAAIPVIGTAANAQWVVQWKAHVTAQAAMQKSTETNPRKSTKKAKADPKAKARTMVSRSSGAVFGSLLGGVLAMFARRMTYFVVSLLSLLVSTYIFGVLNPLHPYYDFAVFGLGFVGTIYFGWLPLYLPELFPTRVRATGTGISFNTGRVFAGFVALGTGGLATLLGSDYAKIGLYTGTIYALGMVVILYAPRTDGKGLKE